MKLSFMTIADFRWHLALTIDVITRVLSKLNISKHISLSTTNLCNYLKMLVILK